MRGFKFLTKVKNPNVVILFFTKECFELRKMFMKCTFALRVTAKIYKFELPSQEDKYICGISNC